MPVDDCCRLVQSVARTIHQLCRADGMEGALSAHCNRHHRGPSDVCMSPGPSAGHDVEPCVTSPLAVDPPALGRAL